MARRIILKSRSDKRRYVHNQNRNNSVKESTLRRGQVKMNFDLLGVS